MRATTCTSHPSAVDIRPGVRVAQGDVIGRVGRSGVVTGPHLDYRLAKGGVFVNPLVEVRTVSPVETIGPESRRAVRSHPDRRDVGAGAAAADRVGPSVRRRRPDRASSRRMIALSESLSASRAHAAAVVPRSSHHLRRCDDGPHGATFGTAPSQPPGAIPDIRNKCRLAKAAGSSGFWHDRLQTAAAICTPLLTAESHQTGGEVVCTFGDHGSHHPLVPKSTVGQRERRWCRGRVAAHVVGEPLVDSEGLRIVVIRRRLRTVRP